jgi:hypothetical protein
MQWIAAVLSLAVLSGGLLAGPFGYFGRRAGGSNSNQTQARPASGGFPTAAAAAAYMASIGRMGHYGNSSGFPFEGVGVASTPDGAVRNCCYYGRRPLADSAVFQGANGMWYACNRYH